MVGLVSLPTELLQMIVACHASDPDCISELASLALVNRRLNGVVNPILYDLDWRRVSHRTPRSVEFATFRNRIEILELIKSLGFDLNRDDRPLHQACAGGGLEAVTWLLDHGMPIHPQSSALLNAIQNKHEDVALLLLDRGANPHVRPVPGFTTYIHEAGSSSMMRVLKVLVREKGIPIDIMDGTGQTILRLAVQWGSEDIVREVIALGADINAEIRGELPLTVAMEQGRFRIAEILLAAGAIVKPRRPRNGVAYPIHACARLNPGLYLFSSLGDKRLYQKEQCDALTRLVNAGADLDERYENRKYRNERYENKLPKIERCKNGYTPLEEAVMKGTLETIRHLLDIGADRGMKDTNGRSVLNVLVSDPQKPDLIERAVVLLKAGARMDVPLFVANGISLLGWAAARTNKGWVRGKDLLQRLLVVATPSMLTYEHLDKLFRKYMHIGNYELRMMLLRHGATLKDPDLRYKAVEAKVMNIPMSGPHIEPGSEDSAYFDAMVGMGLPMQKLADLLPYTLEAKCKAYVEILINHGVLSFLPERPEWLHMAATWGDVDIIRRMMEYPVDVDHVSEYTTPRRIMSDAVVGHLGEPATPLLMAIRHRHIEVAWVLLNHGADPFLPQDTGHVSAFVAAIQTYDDLSLIKEMWSKPTFQDRPDLSAIISDVPVEHERVVEWLRLQVEAQEGNQVKAEGWEWWLPR